MRTLVMGVLNVTPDSFYDGGRYVSHPAAIRRGMEMIDEGADLIDIGGESTRPGAKPLEPVVELDRVLPVVRELAPCVRVSIDTRHVAVAFAALEAGASLLNDVSSTLAPVAAEAGSGLVIMHMQGTPTNMQRHPHYDDVVGEVHHTVLRDATRAHALGVEELYIDPGIGFGKTLEHNLALLRALPELVAIGEKVLIGTSRKRFLGELVTATPDAPPLPPSERLEGSLATAVWSMCCGVAIVRVHDVKATREAACLVGDHALLRHGEGLGAA